MGVLLNDLAFGLSRYLVHSSWQAVAVGAAYLLCRRLLPASPAGARYRAAAATTVLLALLPGLTALLALGLPVAAAPIAMRTVPTGPAAAAATAWLDAELTDRLAAAVLAVWASGVIVGWLRLGLGLFRLRWLVRRSNPVRLSLDLRALATRLGLRDVPPVRESRGLVSPMVVGWRSPVLLLPERFQAALPADQLEAVLLHELAHVRRRDFGTNLCLRAAAALAWYQPFAWLASRDLAREREHCCDELAVRATGGPLPLARALVALEERRRVPPRLALAGTGGDCHRRVRRILSRTGEGRRATLRAVPFGVAVLGLAVVVVLGTGAVAESVSHATARVRRTFVLGHDLAGEFTVRITGGRLVAATIAGRPLPEERIVQRGHTVELLDPAGRPELTLHLTRAGFRWESRPPRPI